MSDSQVSAVLLNWLRPDNLPQVIAPLLDYPSIDDIVIWNNSPEPLSLADYPPNVAQWSCGRNLCTYGRFVAARYAAKHDTIYTQDDDYAIGNIEQIIAGFRDDPERIHASLDEGHMRIDRQQHYGEAHEVLFGWGACFDRRWIGPAFAPYIEAHGEDELLLRKADRIFSLLLNRKHFVRIAEETRLPNVAGPMSLYKMPDHAKLNRLARNRCTAILERLRDGHSS